MHKNVG